MLSISLVDALSWLVLQKNSRNIISLLGTFLTSLLLIFLWSVFYFRAQPMNLGYREENNFLPLLQLQTFFRELFTNPLVSSLFLFWSVLVCEMFFMKIQGFFPPPPIPQQWPWFCKCFQISIYQSFARLTCVMEQKFTCSVHGEAKQSERAQFGAERGLLTGQARRMSGSCSKKSQTPQWFSAKCFYRLRVWATGCVTFFSGWLRNKRDCSRTQREVTILHVGGNLSSFRTQRYWSVCPLRRSLDSALIAALLFLDCSSFVSKFLHFLDSVQFSVWLFET